MVSRPSNAERFVLAGRHRGLSDRARGPDRAGRRVLKIVVAVLGLLAHATSPAGEIRYFDAGSSANNLASLRSQFDGYLSSRGAYSFHAYSSLNEFEQTIPGGTSDILMMSSWHFRRLRADRPLEAILVGVNRNQTINRKILCMRRDAQLLTMLPGRPIAGAGSEDFMRRLLQDMVGKAHRQSIDAARMLIVPKDLDALMAVGYGMATAAFVSEKSLDQLQRINPTLAGQLTAVARSEEILRLIVAARGGYDAGVSKFLDVVTEMQGTPEGERGLQLLGLDGWKRLSETEQKALRP